MRSEQDALELVDLGVASRETLGSMPGIGENVGFRKDPGISDAD